MKCAACRTELVRRIGEIDLEIHGKLYIGRNVSCEECPSCGEKALSPEVSQDLYTKIKHGEFAEQILRIPVLEGTFG